MVEGCFFYLRTLHRERKESGEVAALPEERKALNNGRQPKFLYGSSGAQNWTMQTSLFL